MFEKLFMKILNKERKPKQISILIIGLNNSGKSTIVNFFKNKDDRKSISVPTIGFNIEHFESKWKISLLVLLAVCVHIFYDFDLPQHLQIYNKIFIDFKCFQCYNLILFPQIKVFPLQLMTWLVLEGIGICGNITSRHATGLCL